jgi:hypothetical protein
VRKIAASSTSAIQSAVFMIVPFGLRQMAAWRLALSSSWSSAAR